VTVVGERAPETEALDHFAACHNQPTRAEAVAGIPLRDGEQPTLIVDEDLP
jgi:hypothetical protein